MECDTSSSLVSSDSLLLGCTGPICQQEMTDGQGGTREGRILRGAHRRSDHVRSPLSFACLRLTVFAKLARKPSATRVGVKRPVGAGSHGRSLRNIRNQVAKMPREWERNDIETERAKENKH